MNLSKEPDRSLRSIMADYPVHTTSTPTTEHIPSFLGKEQFISALHAAAAQGERKNIKKLLKKGVAVDAANRSGQTSLYLACHNGHQNVVELLLANGANPNERCCDEATPMHTASYSGNVSVMLKLIEAGGDLRLHDKHNRTVVEWAGYNHDEKKSKKMIEFIKKAQELAVSTSSQKCLFTERKLSSTLESGVGTLFRRKAETPKVASTTLQKTGFGKVCGDGPHVGLLGLIPLVSENQLRHDDYGCTYNNGPFMVMESMQWNHTAVTVKRLHKEPPSGGKVDLLINECENIGRLRHPHLLLLMGVCQTNMMESLVLLYERVGCGSLFTYLYQKNEVFEILGICDILRQICEAVIFLHSQRLLHTSITSHAVQLVTPGLAKLANLDHTIPISSDGVTSQTTAVNNQYPNAVYNWMAPELMMGEPPQQKSDLYSVCAILWELLESMPPMSGLAVSEIRERLLSKQTRIMVRDHIPEPFCTVLKYGLSIKPRDRLVTLEWIRDSFSHFIVERESNQIRTGEIHRRQSRYLPRYNRYPDIPTTTDEEDDTIIVDEKTSRPKLPHFNSTLDSCVTSVGGDQYSIDDIDSMMLSPANGKISVHNIVSTHSSVITPTPAMTSSHNVQNEQEEANTSGGSEESSHTVLEAPVDASIAPTRSSFPYASYPPDPPKPVLTDPSEGKQEAEPKQPKRKFFRSMRRRSSATSTSSVDAPKSETSSKDKSSKSSKLSLLRSVMGRRSSKQFDYSVDISGIGQLESDTATSDQQTPQPKDTESESDHKNDSNPFKKYNKQNLQSDDIISEEVKAILARPHKLLKLPSFYERRPVPNSVYGTLLRQYSANAAVKFPHPTPPLNRRSTIGPSTRISWTDGHLNRSLPASMSTPASANISGLLNCSFPDSNSHLSRSSVSVKPASHYVPSPSSLEPQTSPVNLHIPSVPSISPLAMQASGGRFQATPSPIAPTRQQPVLQRSSTVQVTEATSSTPEQATTRDEWLRAYAGAASPKGSIDDPFAKYRRGRQDHVMSARSQEVHQVASEQQTAQLKSDWTKTKYRSDTYVRSNGTSVSSAQPRPRVVRQNAVIDCSSKGPVKDIIASFQDKVQEHMQKQAILQLKKRDPSSSRDTFSSDIFHTPKANKTYAATLPNRKFRCSLEGPDHAVVSCASVQLQKTVHLVSPKTAHSRAMAKTLKLIQENPEAISSPSAQHSRGAADSRAGGDSDPDVSEYVDKMLSSCHSTVITKYKHPDCPHTPASSSLADDCPQQQLSSVSLHSAAAHTALLDEQDATNERNLNNSSRCTSETGLSGKRRESDEMSAMSEGSRRTERSIEEFYFDDELQPSAVRKARNLRLDNTNNQKDGSLEDGMTNLSLDFTHPPDTPLLLHAGDDYDTPIKTLDATDYAQFKHERKMTRLTEDEESDQKDSSGDSENLIVSV